MTADLHICALSYQLLFSSYFSFFRLGKNVLCFFVFFSLCPSILVHTVLFFFVSAPFSFQGQRLKGKERARLNFFNTFLHPMDGVVLPCLSAAPCCRSRRRSCCSSRRSRFFRRSSRFRFSRRRGRFHPPRGFPPRYHIANHVVVVHAAAGGDDW